MTSLDDEMHRMRFGGHNDDRPSDSVYQRMLEAERQGDTPEMAIQARLKLLREFEQEGLGDLISGPAREALSIGERMIRAMKDGDAEKAADAGFAFGGAWMQLKFKAR